MLPLFLILCVGYWTGVVLSPKLYLNLPWRGVHTPNDQRVWYNADSSVFASAYEHRHLFDKSAPCTSRSGRPTIFLVLRYYLFYVPNPDLHVMSLASALAHDSCTSAQPETSILLILHFYFYLV